MKNRTKDDGFIQSTAKDYDMDPEEVLHIYRKVDGDGTLLYQELESYIKERKELDGKV